MSKVYKTLTRFTGDKKAADGRVRENEYLLKNSSHRQMLDVSKAMVRNNPMADALKDTMETFCGNLTPVKGNQESKRAFKEWAKSAGLQSGQSFGELNSEIIGILTWADCLVVLGSDPYALPGTVSARVKIIDPHCIETPPKYKDKGLVNGMRVILGVALDKNDIEVGYYVRKAGTDGNSDSDYEFLPRYDRKTGRFVSMLVRRPCSTFPGQVRSFPMLLSSLDNIDILNDLDKACVKDAFKKTFFGIVLEAPGLESLSGMGGEVKMVDSETGDISDGSGDGDGNDNGRAENYGIPKINLSEMDSGDVPIVPPGTNPHTISNDGNFEIVSMIEEQIKIISGSLGIPYNILSKNFQGLNFSTCKLLFDTLFRKIEQWNYGPVMRLFNEIYKWVVIEYWLCKGVLPTPDLWECDWKGPAKPDPDPVKSAKAHEMMLKAGTLNRSDIVGERGDDYEDHLRQKKEDETLEEEILGRVLALAEKKSDDDDDDDEDKEDEE